MSTSPENVKSAIQNSPLLWGDVREKIHVCKAQTSKVMGYKSKTVRGKASERCTHQPRAFTTQRERKCSIKARASISSVFSWITSYHLPIYFFFVLPLNTDCGTKLLDMEWELHNRCSLQPEKKKTSNYTNCTVSSSHIILSCHNLFLLKFPI